MRTILRFTRVVMHVAMSNAFAEQQVNFLKNPARPSAVQSTDF